MASESPRTVNGFMVFVGSAAAFIIVTLLAIAFLALNRPAGETLEDKRAAQRNEVRVRLDKEADEKLNKLEWADKAKGLAHAPLTDVFPLVATELKAKKPAPSQVKIDPVIPMPVVDPKATEPPPALLTSAPQGADTIRFVPPATLAPAPAATPAPAAPAPAAPTPPTPAAPAPVPAAPAAPQTTPPAPAAPAPAPAPGTPAPPAPAAPAAPAPANPAPTPGDAKPAPAPAAPEAKPSTSNSTENTESKQ
jgi:hypothetical protein